MVKRILTSLLAVSLLPAFWLPVRGAETQETTQPPAETTQATISTETTPATSPTVQGPVLLTNGEPLLKIDLEHRYEGMDLSYRDGYTPKVEDGTLKIIIPLLKNGEIQGPIDVQLDGLPAGIPEEQLRLQQVTMQTISLEGGVLVENVFLLNFEMITAIKADSKARKEKNPSRSIMFSSVRKYIHIPAAVMITLTSTVTIKALFSICF